VSSPRVLTFTAVTVGAAIGAMAALASSRNAWHAENPRGVADYAPLTSIARDRGNPAIFTLEAPAASAPPSREDPSERGSGSASEAVTDGGQQVADLEAVALSCARGDPDDCLRAAGAYELGRVVAPDPKLARDFLAHAIRKYSELCTEREPAACAALAELHASGHGVPKSDVSAAALRARALESCATRPHSICGQLGGP
jgi:TPR repeat protein